MAFSNPDFCSIIHSPINPAKRIGRNGAVNPNNHGMPIPYSKKISNILENNTLDKLCNKRVKKLKEAKHVLRKVLEEEEEEKTFRMVDSLQRLGIEYHFQDDINEFLENQYKRISTHQNHDLSLAALRFRLLRQQGYYVPADVFKNFKNKEGKFKHELAADIKGLIELHEATHLSIEGEDILDEAQLFSGNLLIASTIHLDDYKAGIVLNTLKNPYHKTLARSQVKNNLHNFKETNKSEDVFMELAKLDFNTLQSFYRDEIVHFSKWWRKDLGLAPELKITREQSLEWFAWPFASLTDPSLSAQRVELTKVVSLFHVIQDVFHFYESIDQLTLFVQAVYRWDIDAANDLPDYMKMCLRALYDITDGIPYKMYKECGYNSKGSLRNAWAKLCNSFLGVAKWVAVGQLPKAEDYLKIVNGTSVVHVVLLHIFFLLGEGISIKTINLVDKDSPIISFVATISLLSDGLRTVKVDGRNCDFGPYMKCYMRQYPYNSSVQEARKQAMNKISDTWKQLNQQCFSPNSFSPSFIRAAVNCARLAPLIYGFDDNRNPPNIHQNMKSMLFDRIAI